MDTLSVFAIGTGIGCGLVIDVRFYLGIGGTGGELGHTVIDFNGLLVWLRHHGCLETYATGPASAVMGIKAVAQGLTPRIADLYEYDLKGITPELIARAAQVGDDIAEGIYEKVGFYLGIATASQAGDLLLEPMRRCVREHVFVMPVDQVEIIRSQLENNAGMIGVACWSANIL